MSVVLHQSLITASKYSYIKAGAAVVRTISSNKQNRGTKIARGEHERFSQSEAQTF